MCIFKFFMGILHIEMFNDRKYKEKVFGSPKDRLI